MMRYVLAALALLAAAPAVHAGIALQTYTPGATDYTNTPATLDGTLMGGESGVFPVSTGKWFAFTMPHAGSLTSLTFPMHVTSRTSPNATINVGFWIGPNPTGSTVGGVTLPASEIAVGQTKEYVMNFPAGWQWAAGSTITLDFSVVNTTTVNGFDAHLFLSNTPGSTFETGLGVIFGGPQTALPAIVVGDNSAPVPEPASIGLLAAGGLLLLKRRRSR